MSQKYDILSLFTYGYHKRRFASDIARYLKLPQKTVSRKLNNCVSEGYLNFIREGRNKYYFIDIRNQSTFVLLLMLESYKANKFILKFPDEFLKLKNANMVFGSYSRFEKGNDIDVVFFNEGDELDEDIHKQETSFDEFEQKLLKKDLLSYEIYENHIILDDFGKIIKLFLRVASDKN